MRITGRHFRWLWAAAALLLAARLGVILWHYEFAALDCRLRELFDPAENESMGAVFLAAVLAFAAMAALSRARSHAGRDRLMWAGLAAALLLLALTRLTDLHREPLAALGSAGTPILAAVLLLAALGFAAWLVTRRPPGARLLLAGLALYLMGAVVLDAASALLFPPSPVLDACRDSVSSLPRDLLGTLETALEMAGIILLAQALSPRAPPSSPRPGAA